MTEVQDTMKEIRDLSQGFCKPEWDLLCRVRSMLVVLLSQKLRARDMRKKVIGIIGQMDDVFDDFPREPND